MGLSFKLARTGTRYRPRPPPPELSSDSASSAAAAATVAEATDCPGGVDGEEGLGFTRNDRKVGLFGLADGLADCSVSSVDGERKSDRLEPAPSFSLNLFPDGFSIGKPTEGMLLPLVKDIPTFLHPYDNASKSLFSAIEQGWLPGEIFDDLPCKYLNGAIVCEIWDYRSFLSKRGQDDPSIDEFPKVQKVRLQMGMETVVKDMASISDDSWTYNDLLQAESQVVKALRPVLYLAPEPSLDRLCQPPVSKQLDLGIYHRILKRKCHDGQEPVLDHTDHSQHKLIPCNALLENVRPGTPDTAKGGGESSSTQFTARIPSLEQNNSGKERWGAASPLILPLSHSSASGDSFFLPDTLTLSSSTIPASDQVLNGSFTGLKDSRHFITGKSSKLNAVPSSVEPTTFVTPKQEAPDIEFGQNILGQKAKILEPHLPGKIAQLHQEQGNHNARHVRPHHRSYSEPEVKEAVSGKQLFLGAPIPSPLYKQNAQSIDELKLAEFRNLSEKEALKGKDDHALVIRSDKQCPKLPLPSMKTPVSHVHWIKTGASQEKAPKKETASRKRKLSQAPQISAGGSLDCQIPQHGGKQKSSLHISASRFPDAPTVDLSNSTATSGLLASAENAAMNSFCNSLTRETQVSSCAVKISKPINRNPPISTSDSWSQRIIGDSNLPSSSKSISVGTLSLLPLPGTDSDRAILERFSRIEKLVQRHGLDNKQSKPHNFVLTRSLPRTYLSQHCLVMAEETEKFIPLTDKACMSKCLIDGSRNVCKTRILSYRRVRILHRGNGNPLFLDDPWSKLILSEHDGNGKVAAIIYGDDERIVHLPLLPTPDYADLFAAQFTSLMAQEGYELVDDRFQAGLGEMTSVPINDLLHNCFHEFPEHPCTPQIPNQPMMTAPFASDMATLNLPGYPLQSLLSPVMPLPCLNLTRPQQLEGPNHVSKSIYMPQPLSDRALPVRQQNSLGPMCHQIPDSSQLQLIHLQQQFQQQQYQKQLMMQQNLMTNQQSMGTDFGIRHTLALNDQRISGFCNSNQLLNSGISPIQAAVLARINRSQVTGLMDNAAISDTLSGTGGIAGNSLLVSQALSRNNSNPDQFQATGSLTSCSDDSILAWQHQLQQPKLHQLVRLQQEQHHLAMPQLNGSVLVTRMNQSAPMQVNTAIGNISSPQLSAQTVGSGGSITSSPQCISKPSTGRNAS